MSILFHHYKELKECMSEVERMEAKVTNNGSSKNKGLTIKEEQEGREEEEEEVLTTTLDSYFIKNKVAEI